jgi:hypothetical protein
MPDHADLNARAAKLAGWKHRDYYAFPWFNTSAVRYQRRCPDYCSSLDLIRRDLLSLVEKAGAMFDLENRLEDVWATPQSGDYPRMVFALTADPAIVVTAILEVLNG